MKKLLILIATFALIAVLAVGTTAFAKGGDDNPVDQWQVLIEKVNDIWGVIVGTDENVTAIGEKIEYLYDNSDNITKMETYSGTINANLGNNDENDPATLEDDYVLWTFPEVRHISLTVHPHDVTGIGSYIWMSYHIGDSDYSPFPDTLAENETTMIELDTDYLRVWLHHAGPSDPTPTAVIEYNLTSTYPASSAP